MKNNLELIFLVLLAVGLPLINCTSSLLLQHSTVGKHSHGRIVFDLLQDLDGRNRTHLLKVRGFHGRSPAFKFSGERVGRVSASTTKEVITALNTAQEYSFLAIVKQRVRNVGSIIAFTHRRRSRSGKLSDFRLAEMQSAWRKRELRFHYLMQSSVNMVATERLAYQVADDHWHRVSLSISGEHVSLYVDCQRIYERALSSPLRHHLFAQPGIRLWVGQRGGRASFFEGVMQDVKIVVGSNGFLEQCPELNHNCPTCGQFMSLSHTAESLAKEIQNMKKQMTKLEKRMTDRENCDCLKRCTHAGQRFESGEKWKMKGCLQCHCQNGTVICIRQPCPTPKCRNPVKIDGECCPKCLRGCQFKGVYYEHGVNRTWSRDDEEEEEEEEEEEHEGDVIKKCALCDCSDGQMKCRLATQSQLCPKLDCPRHQVTQDPRECCPYCQNADHCGRGHDCHVNASCINLHNKYFCECKKGFRGSGHWCIDVDECASEIGGDYGHYCGQNTVCVNTIGSYKCTCLPGYKHVSKYECADRNECEDGTHQCDKNAICNNTLGTHACQCKEGYVGNGETCKPICQESCLNGGKCFAPNTCRCPHGFYGTRCQYDLDECELGIAKCSHNSRCVNVPGRYFCQCRHGYSDNGALNNFGQLCQDVNECLSDHTCHDTAECVNTVGGFVCQCRTSSNTKCKDCIYRPNRRRRIDVRHGTKIDDLHDKCKECMCQEGVLTCSKKACDCTKREDTTLSACCPNCQPTTCVHQDTGEILQSGVKWIYDCEECQCINGTRECHPLTCPHVSCPIPVHQPGHCCPECPGENPCSGSPGQPALLEEGLHRAGPPKACSLEGLSYSHGAQWHLRKNPCLSCSCQDGHVCCAHSEQCTREKLDKIRRLAAARVAAALGARVPATTPSSHTSTQSFSRSAPPASALSSTGVWSSVTTSNEDEDSSRTGDPEAASQNSTLP